MIAVIFRLDAERAKSGRLKAAASNQFEAQNNNGKQVRMRQRYCHITAFT